MHFGEIFADENEADTVFLLISKGVETPVGLCQTMFACPGSSGATGSRFVIPGLYSCLLLASAISGPSPEFPQPRYIKGNSSPDD